MTQSNIALLPDRGLIEVAGPDAGEFLQGLITNDIDRAEGQNAVFAAMLTPQGKILFDFFILARGDGIFWLECGKDQASALFKRLSMYKLRAKVTITDRSEEFAFAADWGEASHEPTAIAAYGDPRFALLGQRLILPADDPRITAFDDDLTAYHQHRIGLVVPEAPADYQYGESFAHEASFDHLNGVDFTKGCFVGQEVVSRMQHRASIRKRVAMVTATQDLPDDSPPVLVGEVEIGRLGSVAGQRGLALVRIDRVAEARRDGVVLTAGGVPIDVAAPPFATFRIEAPHETA